MSKIHEAAFDANISTLTQTFGFTFYYRRRNRLPDQLTVLPAFFAAPALGPVFDKQPFERIVRQLISLFCPSGCGACARRLVAPFTGVWIETLARGRNNCRRQSLPADRAAATESQVSYLTQQALGSALRRKKFPRTGDDQRHMKADLI